MIAAERNPIISSVYPVSHAMDIQARSITELKCLDSPSDGVYKIAIGNKRNGEYSGIMVVIGGVGRWIIVSMILHKYGPIKLNIIKLTVASVYLFECGIVWYLEKLLIV